MVVNALGFLSTLVLARILSPADFGLVSLATALLAIFSAVTEMSLASALIRHGNPTDEHFHTVWTLNLGRGVLIGLAFALAGYPASLVYGEPRIIPVMLALGAGLAVSGLANPRMALFARALSFKQEFIVSVAEKLASFIAAVTAAVLLRSYWALVAGAVAMQVTRVATSYLIVPYSPRFSWKHVRELLSFSVWVTLGTTVDSMNGRIDQLLMGFLLGRQELGYYTVGDTIASLPTREATAPLSAMLLPAFSHVRGDQVRLREAYTSAQTLISAVAFPVAFGLPLIAGPFVRLTLGEKWASGVLVVQIISIVIGLQTLSSAVKPMAFALGATREYFFRDLLYFCVRLPFVVGGLVIAGLPGLLYARLLVGLIAIYINMRLVRSLIGISAFAQLMANWRALLSVALMWSAVMGVHVRSGIPESGREAVVAIALSVIVGAFTYVVATLVLWWLAGRPNGPEHEILRVVRRVLPTRDAAEV